MHVLLFVIIEGLILVFIKIYLNISILQFDLQIHDVSDKDVKNVDKKFKEGSISRVRVLGVRHLEGVAIGTLKVITSGHLVFLVVVFLKTETGGMITPFVIICLDLLLNIQILHFLMLSSHLSIRYTARVTS